MEGRFSLGVTEYSLHQGIRAVCSSEAKRGTEVAVSRDEGPVFGPMRQTQRIKRRGSGARMRHLPSLAVDFRNWSRELGLPGGEGDCLRDVRRSSH